MNDTIIALLLYISWILILLLVLAAYRTSLTASGKKQGLKFQADGSDIPAMGERITRVHANAVECFSFIGGVMLLAIATDSTAITNDLAMVVVAARLLQSAVHLASTSNVAIQARFVFFLVQFAIVGYWVFKLFQKFLM
ncbi:MAPEG family protein [Glaciecola sp. MH2013]|uniref:MAPEG family protein n=1 Tax=Glaciecola sp. MH2013 TaxID=2785524 RepID=UPI0018A086D8|nr:MAPEG family protein [Glaciecola sp. MH2013]MBF7074062.1 MAPEG family protein [Glaciecola sp. MH2013]